jgi:hypothetical protein
LPNGNQVVENHVPLLSLHQIEQLEDLSEDLDLTDAADQETFVSRIHASDIGVDNDRTLEYLVNVRDLPVGGVIASVRLAEDCSAARRIHWGAEQLKRHKAGSGSLAAATISQEMVGADA